jgi:3-isopropylmalate/(R)-2-methylmalate dehydratase small subunit
VQPGDIIVAGENFGVGSARPIGNVFSKLGVAGVIAASFNGLGLRNCVNYGIQVLPCPGVGAVIADGDRIAADWEGGNVRNLNQGTEIAGRPLPAALLELAEKGGVIPILQAEGLLEDAE